MQRPAEPYLRTKNQNRRFYRPAHTRFDRVCQILFARTESRKLSRQFSQRLFKVSLFRTLQISVRLPNPIGVSALLDKTYDTAEAAELSKQIADQVSSLVRDLNMRRYKHVVQVTLGQQLGSGCRYIARCRWDAECDNQTSDVFTNASLFCICTVFGVYLY